MILLFWILTALYSHGSGELEHYADSCELSNVHTSNKHVPKDLAGGLLKSIEAMCFAIGTATPPQSTNPTSEKNTRKRKAEPTLEEGWQSKISKTLSSTNVHSENTASIPEPNITPPLTSCTGYDCTYLHTQEQGSANEANLISVICTGNTSNAYDDPDAINIDGDAALEDILPLLSEASWERQPLPPNSTPSNNLHGSMESQPLPPPCQINITFVHTTIEQILQTPENMRALVYSFYQTTNHSAPAPESISETLSFIHTNIPSSRSHDEKRFCIKTLIEICTFLISTPPLDLLLLNEVSSQYRSTPFPQARSHSHTYHAICSLRTIAKLTYALQNLRENTTPRPESLTALLQTLDINSVNACEALNQSRYLFESPPPALQCPLVLSPAINLSLKQQAKIQDLITALQKSEEKSESPFLSSLFTPADIASAPKLRLLPLQEQWIQLKTPENPLEGQSPNSCAPQSDPPKNKITPKFLNKKTELLLQKPSEMKEVISSIYAKVAYSAHLPPSISEMLSYIHANVSAEQDFGNTRYCIKTLIELCIFLLSRPPLDLVLLNKVRKQYFNTSLFQEAKHGIPYQNMLFLRTTVKLTYALQSFSESLTPKPPSLAKLLQVLGINSVNACEALTQAKEFLQNKSTHPHLTLPRCTSQAIILCQSSRAKIHFMLSLLQSTEADPDPTHLSTDSNNSHSPNALNAEDFLQEETAEIVPSVLQPPAEMPTPTECSLQTVSQEAYQAPIIPKPTALTTLFFKTKLEQILQDPKAMKALVYNMYQTADISDPAPSSITEVLRAIHQDISPGRKNDETRFCIQAVGELCTFLLSFPSLDLQLLSEVNQLYCLSPCPQVARRSHVYQEIFLMRTTNKLTYALQTLKENLTPANQTLTEVLKTLEIDHSYINNALDQCISFLQTTTAHPQLQNPLEKSDAAGLCRVSGLRMDYIITLLRNAETNADSIFLNPVSSCCESDPNVCQQEQSVTALPQNNGQHLDPHRIFGFCNSILLNPGLIFQSVQKLHPIPANQSLSKTLSVIYRESGKTTQRAVLCLLEICTLLLDPSPLNLSLFKKVQQSYPFTKAAVHYQIIHLRKQAKLTYMLQHINPITTGSDATLESILQPVLTHYNTTFETDLDKAVAQAIVWTDSFQGLQMISGLTYEETKHSLKLCTAKINNFPLTIQQLSQKEDLYNTGLTAQMEIPFANLS